MPDENKFHLLDAIGWREHPVCGLCVHFTGLHGDWGRCSAFSYDHNRHTGNRPLGVHAYGGCDSFERDASRATAFLHSYAGRKHEQENENQKEPS